jgi:hypothetical protein
MKENYRNLEIEKHSNQKVYKLFIIYHIMFNIFKIKKSSVVNLTEEDKKELEDIERQNYMNEAKKLITERGIQKAKRDFSFQVDKGGKK